MKPSILLLGKNGQIGAALRKSLLTLGNLVAHDRTTCDLTNVRQLRAVIREAKPSVIVNASAYTAVDNAEDDEALCNQINAQAPCIMAEEASRLNAHLIHYSTDYVFDGNKATPYVEDDVPCPVSAYGCAKLRGDEAVLSLCSASTIVRVSWVYGNSGRNFPKTILALAADRDELRIVSDQFGAPTSADLIADVTTRIAKLILASRNDSGRENNSADLSGVFNLAPRGRVSWHGYAIELIEEALREGRRLRVPLKGLIPVSSSDYPTRARRPKNSVLDTTKICRVLSTTLPDWQPSVRRFVRELQR